MLSHARRPSFRPPLAMFAASRSGALAQKKYDTGATDTEIKIGNIMPYSGPASAYGVIGKTEAAYFKKINDEGGINGRKINFITYDDAYSPPKAVEQARKLVESDEVLLIFNPLGTPSNTAIQKYMNPRRCRSCSSPPAPPNGTIRRTSPGPWAGSRTTRARRRSMRSIILKEKPDAKIAVLYQNDDYGKDYLKGLKDGLGAKAASMIVAEESYETSEPTIDNHIVKLKIDRRRRVHQHHHAEIRGAGDQEGRRDRAGSRCTILNNVSASVGGVMKPAGFENAQGIISAAYLKDPTDTQWDNDPGMKEFVRVHGQVFSRGRQDRRHRSCTATASAQTLVQVLKQCGDNLTRENVMKQAASLKDFRTECCCPASGSTPGRPISRRSTQLQLMRFKGENWELFGDIINGEVGG